jgi:SAM-dependent methyltransferase
VHAVGWALGAERVVGTLGEVTAEASVGLESPDVATRFPGDPTAESARFELKLPTDRCPRGINVLTVVATLAGGRELRVERPITVEPYDPPGAGTPAAIGEGAIAMSCDMPPLGDDDGVSSPIRISGWCYARDGVDRVQAFLDSNRRYDLIFPTPRRDVWEFFGARDALLSGFDLRLGIEDCPPGRHSLVVLATTADGHTVGQSGTFVCLEEPAGAASGEGSPTGDEQAIAPESPFDDRLAAFEQRARAQAEVERRARYRWAAPLAVGKAVLDVACGAGEGTAILAEAGATRAVGVDRAEAELGSAHARVGQPAEFQVVDLDSLPFADDAFDLVVAFDVETVPAQAGALDELCRVLGPHGVVLVSSRDEDLLSSLGARWRHVRRWEQQTFATTVVGEPAGGALDDGELRLEAEPLSCDAPPRAPLPVVVAGASDMPVPDVPGIAVVGTFTQLQALLDELDYLSLRARVAEKHAVVSTLEGDVIQNYHQELLRSHLAVKSELAAGSAEREAERARAASVEHVLEDQRRSFTWQITSPLRAVKRRGRRRRSL